MPNLEQLATCRVDALITYEHPRLECLAWGRCTPEQKKETDEPLMRLSLDSLFFRSAHFDKHVESHDEVFVHVRVIFAFFLGVCEIQMSLHAVHLPMMNASLAEEVAWVERSNYHVFKIFS